MGLKPIVFIGESHNSSVYVARQHAFFKTCVILASWVEKKPEPVCNCRPGLRQEAPTAPALWLKKIGANSRNSRINFAFRPSLCPSRIWHLASGIWHFAWPHVSRHVLRSLGERGVPNSTSQSKSDQIRPLKFMNPTQNSKTARNANAKPGFGRRSVGAVLAVGLHSAIRNPQSAFPNSPLTPQSELRIPHSRNPT